jgi:Tautomerase enzyme
LGPSDLRVDPYYPALPKPRTDQMLMIEVLVSSGTDTNRRKGLVAAMVEKLGEAGIDPNDIMVFFLETDRASGSFGGGRFAPPVAWNDPLNWHNRDGHTLRAMPSQFVTSCAI